MDSVVLAWCSVEAMRFEPCCNCCYLQLSNAAFRGTDSKVYCEQHYIAKFADVCASCGLPVLDEVLDALEKRWHPDCFCCAHCGEKNLVSFAVHDGKPYCEVSILAALELACTILSWDDCHIYFIYCDNNVHERACTAASVARWRCEASRVLDARHISKD